MSQNIKNSAVVAGTTSEFSKKEMSLADCNMFLHARGSVHVASESVMQNLLTAQI